MHQGSVLEPSLVTPVMGHEACEAQPEGRVLVSGMRFVCGMHRDHRYLPVAPVTRRLLVDGGIRVHEKAMVGLNKTSLSVFLWDACLKPAPCLGRAYADATGDPLDLRRRGGGDAEEHHLSHALGMLPSIGEGQG